VHERSETDASGPRHLAAAIDDRYRNLFDAGKLEHRRARCGRHVKGWPTGSRDVNSASRLPRVVRIESLPEDFRLHVFDDQIVAAQAERRLDIE
jgi:hypothetical protein